jgi:hypothetical protein
MSGVLSDESDISPTNNVTHVIDIIEFALWIGIVIVLTITIGCQIAQTRRELYDEIV